MIVDERVADLLQLFRNATSRLGPRQLNTHRHSPKRIRAITCPIMERIIGYLPLNNLVFIMPEALETLLTLLLIKPAIRENQPGRGDTIGDRGLDSDPSLPRVMMLDLFLDSA